MLLPKGSPDNGGARIVSISLLDITLESNPVRADKIRKDRRPPLTLPEPGRPSRKGKSLSLFAKPWGRGSKNS